MPQLWKTRPLKQMFWDVEENKHLRPENWQRIKQNWDKDTSKQCRWCKKTNHAEEDCHFKNTDNDKNGLANTLGNISTVVGAVLMSCHCPTSDLQEWVGDTGATHHITKTKKNMYNI